MPWSGTRVSEFIATPPRPACARPERGHNHTSIINVSATCARVPTTRISSARDASTVSSTNTPQKSWYRHATPTHDGSSPRSAKSRSAGPFTAEPAISGLTATTQLAGHDLVSRSGDREDRADREHRVDHDGLRGGECLEHSRGRPRGIGAVEPDVEHRGLAPLPNEPLLVADATTPVSLEAVIRVGTRSWVIGSRRHGSPQAAAISAVTAEQRRPRPQALGAEQVRQGPCRRTRCRRRNGRGRRGRQRSHPRVPNRSRDCWPRQGHRSPSRDRGRRAGRGTSSSSPVFTITVTSRGSTTSSRPRRNRADPTPPASTTIMV